MAQKIEFKYECPECGYLSITYYTTRYNAPIFVHDCGEVDGPTSCPSCDFPFYIGEMARVGYRTFLKRS